MNNAVIGARERTQSVRRERMPLGQVLGTGGEFLDEAFKAVARRERRQRRASLRQRAFPPFGFWLIPTVGRFTLEAVPAQLRYQSRVRWWAARRARLAEELTRSRWRASPPIRFLREVPGKAPRPITKPAFEDCVVSLALAWALSRHLSDALPDCAHGWRPERGTGTAVRAWLQAAREGRLWAAPLDVRQCFDRIPWRPLWAVLGRLVDRPTLRVVQALAGSASPTGEGLGQGFAHVPILATLYLAPALRAAGPECLLVYADDLLVVARTAEEACAQLARIQARLHRLGLEVRTSGPALCDQTSYLSVCLRPTQGGGLAPVLSNDCTDRLESLPPEARARRRAGLSNYMDGIRKLCSLAG